MTRAKSTIFPRRSAPSPSNVQDDPGRLRIAVSFKIPFSGVPAKLDPRVRKQVEGVAETLAALGHDVVEQDLNHGYVGVSFMPRSTRRRRRLGPARARTSRCSITARSENIRIGKLLQRPAAAVRARLGRHSCGDAPVGSSATSTS